MTTPSGGSAPPPTLSTPSVAGLDEVVRQGDRLGLTWKLRPGTVQFPPSADTTKVSVILDGDSDAVETYSLIGPIVPGTRVMTMHVPPSGNYAVGYVGDSSQSPTTLIKGVQVDTAGIINAGIGATETNISRMQLASVPVIAGRRYRIQGGMVNVRTVHTDVFDMNIRESTALTGNLVITNISNSAVGGNTWQFDATYTPASSGTIDLFVSIDRSSGSGVMDVYGTSGDSRSWIAIVDAGNVLASWTST